MVYSMGPVAIPTRPFNGLCAQVLEERGQRLDFDQMKRDLRFWEKVSERVIAEAVPDHWKFDTVIVDEGQDFEPIWADMLRCRTVMSSPVRCLRSAPSRHRRRSAFLAFDTRIR